MEDKKKYKKKGFVQQSIGAIITLIVGVGVAVLVLIFVGALGGQTYNLIENDIEEIAHNVVTGQTFTVLNNTPFNLNFPIDPSTFSVMNGSDIVASTGNYYISYTTGQFNLINNAYNNSDFAFNYTWGESSIRNSIQGGITSSFQALEQTGNYLPIIVLAVVISLVLILVLGFTSFGGGGMGGKSSAL